MGMNQAVHVTYWNWDWVKFPPGVRPCDPDGLFWIAGDEGGRAQSTSVLNDDSGAGRALWIECKRPDEPLPAGQRRFLCWLMTQPAWTVWLVRGYAADSIPLAVSLWGKYGAARTWDSSREHFQSLMDAWWGPRARRE